MTTTAPAPIASPTTDAAQATGFRIVNPNWTHPHTNQWCQLAETSDGRRIARHSVPGQHGKSVHLYFLVDPIAPVTPLNNYDDQQHRLIQTLDRDRAHPKKAPGTLETPLDLEAQRFRREWPYLAAHFGLDQIKVPRLFEVGRDCWRPSSYDRVVAGDVDWRTYLDAHGAGDFGVEGKLADVGPLTEEQRWLIDIEPQAVRNAEAIGSGLGVVRSVWRPVGPTGQEFVIRVETALMRDPRKNFTYITVWTQAR